MFIVHELKELNSISFYISKNNEDFGQDKRNILNLLLDETKMNIFSKMKKKLRFLNFKKHKKYIT